MARAGVPWLDSHHQLTACALLQSTRPTLLCVPCTLLPCCLQSNVAAATQPGTAPSLGTRRRLVVLRCPRLGSAQQAGVDDAVAASVSLLPACAAAINLQLMAIPGAAAASEQEDGESLLPGGAAPALQPAPTAWRNLQQPVGAVANDASGAGGAQLPGSEQQADTGGLSAYLSSWFSSPSKAARPPSPPAEMGLAAAVRSGNSTPRAHSPAVLAIAANSNHVAVASPRRQGAPTAGPAATQAAQAAHSGGDGAAAGRHDLRGVVGELEVRLAPLLPSVGVVHLGCLQAAESFVLRWRQSLQVVAEPSECLAGRVVHRCTCLSLLNFGTSPIARCECYIYPQSWR